MPTRASVFASRSIGGRPSGEPKNNRTAATAAAEALNATVADMRFVKPLDEALIVELANSHALLVTLEENAVMGGAGAAVSEYLSAMGIVMPVLHLGLPDTYIEHDKHANMLALCGLDQAGILKSIETRWQSLSLAERKSL